MPLTRVLIPLILAMATVVLQACYQDSPPSTPPRTVDSLVSLLNDRDWTIRRTAAEALGKIGEREALPHLVSSLGDESPVVREVAARSLGRLGLLSAEAERRLAALLLDPSPAVQHAAAHSLSNEEIGQEAFSAIMATLSNERSEARSAGVSALLDLDRVGAAREALVRHATDGDAHVRQLTMAVLGGQDDARGVALLLDRLEHDADARVRAEAAYHLGFHAEDTVSAGLAAAAAQDASAQVRRWAGQSLARLTANGGLDSNFQPIQLDPSGLPPRSR